MEERKSKDDDELEKARPERRQNVKGKMRTTGGKEEESDEAGWSVGGIEGGETEGIRAKPVGDWAAGVREWTKRTVQRVGIYVLCTEDWQKRCGTL